MKHIRERAPASIARELRLFTLRGGAVFSFNLFEDADGRDIIARLFLQAAFADAMLILYPEVPRRRRRFRLRLEFIACRFPADFPGDRFFVLVAPPAFAWAGCTLGDRFPPFFF